jgi:hypothetical protein
MLKFGCSTAGIMGLNLAAFIDIRLLCCVTSNFRDGLITVSEQSYRMCLCNCV